MAAMARHHDVESGVCGSGRGPWAVAAGGGGSRRCCASGSVRARDPTGGQGVGGGGDHGRRRRRRGGTGWTACRRSFAAPRERLDREGARKGLEGGERGGLDLGSAATSKPGSISSSSAAGPRTNSRIEPFAPYWPRCWSLRPPRQHLWPPPVRGVPHPACRTNVVLALAASPSQGRWFGGRVSGCFRLTLRSRP